MVWESQGLTRGPRHQGQVAALQSKIESATSLRDAALDDAVAALEACLQRSQEESGLLSATMVGALQAVVSAERRASSRRRLAERLEAGGGGGKAGEATDIRALLKE